MLYDWYGLRLQKRWRLWKSNLSRGLVGLQSSQLWSTANHAKWCEKSLIQSSYKLIRWSLKSRFFETSDNGPMFEKNLSVLHLRNVMVDSNVEKGGIILVLSFWTCMFLKHKISSNGTITFVSSSYLVHSVNMHTICLRDNKSIQNLGLLIKRTFTPPPNL